MIRWSRVLRSHTLDAAHSYSVLVVQGAHITEWPWYGASSYPPPTAPCPTNNFVLKKYGPNGVLVGHGVQCAQQSCETAVTHPEAQDTQPIQSTKRWRSPISTFQGRSPCCGPASCGKAEHAPRAWGPSCSWHGQEWQPDLAQGPLGQTDFYKLTNAVPLV